MPTLSEYAAAREAQLARLVERLRADGRFVAAWLYGSYGRGEQDAWSDLDVAIVVAEAHAATLCARPWQVGAGTTRERLALYRWLGEPAFIHENHHNALPGGTGAVVYYTDASQVDWFLMPQSQAVRPMPSLVLFDTVGFPPQTPRVETLAERQHRLGERVAFFWMMAAVTVKYMRRGDLVASHTFRSGLHEIVREVERLLAGEAAVYRKGPRVPLHTAEAAHAQAIRDVCGQMLALMPQVAALGGVVPDDPMAVVETLLTLENR